MKGSERVVERLKAVLYVSVTVAVAAMSHAGGHSYSFCYFNYMLIMS
jgi:hypothetical protein